MKTSCHDQEVHKTYAHLCTILFCENMGVSERVLNETGGTSGKIYKIYTVNHNNFTFLFSVDFYSNHLFKPDFQGIGVVFKEQELRDFTIHCRLGPIFNERKRGQRRRGIERHPATRRNSWGVSEVDKNS